MKKIQFLASMALLLVGCAEDAGIDNTQQILNSGRTFVATIENNQTRAHVEGLSIVWDDEDVVSVLDGVGNLQYKYSDESGEFAPVNSGVLTYDVYAIYPYGSGNSVQDGTISLTLPAEQTYAENSFGRGANTMVAKLDGDKLCFKNVGAYLELKLYGEDISVKSITLRGNKGEQLSGDARVSFDANGVPTYEWAEGGEANTSITLTCPEEGVTVGDTEQDATSFWFVVPPMKYSNGFKITVTDTDNKMFIKGTSNEVELERNHVQPMTELNVQMQPTEADKVWVYDENGERTVVEIGVEDGVMTNFLPIDINPETLVPSGENLVARQAITNIAIPEGVTTLDFGALAYCTNLESITLPESLETIGVGAFGMCESLTSVDIPESVTAIGDLAFAGCTSLTDVNIPSGVTTIGSSTFAQCSSLTSVEIPSGVTTIGNGAFAQSGLESVEIPSSVTTIGMQAFAQTGLKTVVIEEGTEPLVFEAQAFAGCTQLESVSIPSNVATITDSAFWGCSSLSSVTLAEGIQTIGAGAFCDCGSLQNITLPNTLTAIETQAFKNTALEGELVIPNSVTRIDMMAFLDDNGNNRLTKITLSNQLQIIQQQTFAGCTYLEEIDFNSAPIKQIGANAFNGCNLGRFEVKTTASGLTLDASALHSCGAYGIILPAVVVSIGHDAFGVQPNVEAAKDLKWIHCKATIPPALVEPAGAIDFCFASNSSLSKIYIPDGREGDYNSNKDWNVARFQKTANGAYNIDESGNVTEVGSGGGYKKIIDFVVGTPPAEN